MYSVYCIIVTYNGEKWIRECLSTIDEPNLNLTILVIDNNSSDQTIPIIKNEFPFVKLIKKKENIGFGGANNYGYKIAKNSGADYIYLLNQDTTSYQDNIFKLISASMKIENVGVVSPIHLNKSGTLFDPDFELYITAKTCKNYISDISLGNVKDFYELGFINAAAWLIKVETVEYLGGLFSSAFFHYGEDVNFIGRLRKFGFKNIIIPGVFIHHCKDDRVKGISSKFQTKVIDINKVNIMHDINSSYKSCYVNLLKYALQQLMLGNIASFSKLISYPIFNYFQIVKYRKSYVSRSLNN